MPRVLSLLALLSLAACPERKTHEAAPAQGGAAPVEAADAGVAPLAASARLVGPITLAPLAAGKRLRVDHRTTLFLAGVQPLSDGGSTPTELSSEEIAAFDVEVLAADGPEIRKARLTFRELVHRSAGEDGGVRPRGGKIWTVEWSATGPVVTRADGKPVPADEAVMISASADLVRPTELQLSLARGKLPAGTTLPGLARDFGVMYARRERLAGGPAPEVTVTGAKVDEVGEALVVEVEVELKSSDKNLKMVSFLKGTAELSTTTGLMRSLNLSGPVELTIEGAGRSGGRLVESTTIE